jgi:hypothetical protein
MIAAAIAFIAFIFLDFVDRSQVRSTWGRRQCHGNNSTLLLVRPCRQCYFHTHRFIGLCLHRLCLSENDSRIECRIGLQYRGTGVRGALVCERRKLGIRNGLQFDELRRISFV